MFINAIMRQQISVYSILIFACSYSHIWKSRGTKIFLVRYLANHVLYPSLLNRGAALVWHGLLDCAAPFA